MGSSTGPCQHVDMLEKGRPDPRFEFPVIEFSVVRLTAAAVRLTGNAMTGHSQLASVVLVEGHRPNEKPPTRAA